MSYDYLGLGKPKKEKRSDFDTNFLDMNSDYTGLGSFAANRAREAGKARKYVKGQVKQYRNDISEIRKEAREFKEDFKDGGWLGQYIKKKLNKSKRPKKFSHRF